MPTIITTSSIAAGATATPLAGTQYEFVDGMAVVQIGFLAEATGILATCYMGRDLVLEEAPAPIGSANQVPVYPDHYLVSETVADGTRLKLQLRNSSGGTVVVKTAVRING
jgi:hypothetical protein